MEAKYEVKYKNSCEYLGLDYNRLKNFIDDEGWLNAIPVDNDKSVLYNYLYDSAEKSHNKIRPI